jgi:hypothetical protein
MNGQSTDGEATLEEAAQSLLPKCAQRDEAAWTELQKLFPPAIRDAIARSNFRRPLSPAAREEIELGVWEKLVERLPHLIAPSRSLLGYLRAATSSSIADYWSEVEKNQRRRVALNLDTVADPHLGAEAASDDAIQLLTAVKHMLPQGAIEAIGRFARGEDSLDTAVQQLRKLPARDSKPQSVPPPPKAATVSAPSKLEELAQQVVALEAVYPPPGWADISADARWFQEQQAVGGFAPYCGTHVAVYGGKVVGTGENSLQLQIDLARKFGVHPQRFIIEYIPRPGEFF